jgi:hypothetical protein
MRSFRSFMPRKLSFDRKVGIGLCAALLFVAWFSVRASISIAVFYVCCGLLDISRQPGLNRAMLRRYFVKPTIDAWLCAPVNLFFDLVSPKSPPWYRMSDLPEKCQQELRLVLEVFDKRGEEIAARCRASTSRSMLFYKWFNQDLDRSIPEFNQEFSYIKTIGVSTLGPHSETSTHFGPLRMTYRALYSFVPIESSEAYIDLVGTTRNTWKTEPLFIFDDTLLHHSVNDTGQPRPCAFIDLIRPSHAHWLCERAVDLVGIMLAGRAGRIFYRKWTFVD